MLSNVLKVNDDYNIRFWYMPGAERKSLVLILYISALPSSRREMIKIEDILRSPAGRADSDSIMHDPLR